MHSHLRSTLVDVLGGVLRPLISLCLRCGIGYTEFRAVSRAVFVAVAADEYGIRGRPTNSSRIAAMTGISRKEVKRVRDQLRNSRWTPAMEVSPANLLLHYWHFDREFVDTDGLPAALPVEGKASFSELARRYAGDIPMGALKEELKRAGVISEVDGLLVVEKRYSQASSFDEDFVRNFAFSLKSLGTTIVHNAQLVSREDFSDELNNREGRFERFAWSDQLDDTAREQFRAWVREEGKEFIESADRWIGQNELDVTTWDMTNPKSIGVGVYFFEED